MLNVMRLAISEEGTGSEASPGLPGIRRALDKNMARIKKWFVEQRLKIQRGREQIKKRERRRVEAQAERESVLLPERYSEIDVTEQSHPIVVHPEQEPGQPLRGMSLAEHQRQQGEVQAEAPQDDRPEVPVVKHLLPSRRRRK